MKRVRSGFTLIELLLSMGIIGTLSSIIMAAVNPTAQFSAAHDAQRRVMQRGLHNSVLQYIVDVGAYPGDKAITTTPQDICRQTVTSPTCINMDRLVSDGYIASLPVDISETDPLLTGYQVALVESRPTVTSVYVGTGINPAEQCAFAFTSPGFFVDGNGDNGLNKDVTKGVWISGVDAALLNGTLYAGWSEGGFFGPPYQVRVVSYNGNDASPVWSFVDGNGVNGINKDPVRAGGNVQITAFNGKLYATWNEVNAGGVSQIRVKVYSGGVWTFVDGNGANGLNKDVTKLAQIPQLTVFNNKLYAIWQETNGSTEQIRVRVYNGNDGSPSWTFVDGNGVNGINKNTARSAQSPQLTVFNSKLYTTWYESNGSTEQVRIAVYNGNDGSPSWSFVDGNGANGINKDVAQNAMTSQLTVFNSKLYLTWRESNATAEQIRVAVYNGNDGSPSWTFLDGNGVNGLTTGVTNPYYPQLVVSDNVLYAMWGGWDDGKVRMVAYNGNDSSPSWTFVDGGVGLNRDPSRLAYALQMIDVNGTAYALFFELNNSGVAHARVRREDACN